MSSSGSVTKAAAALSSSSSPNSTSTESLDGLKFGQKIYFEDVSVAAAATTTQGAKTSAGVSSSKKGRGGSVQRSQLPRCQVEGCNADLSGAKPYYSRHKVCVMHSKSPVAVVAGIQQRFCQQCSRFHLLYEFDQGKRSCRRRLADHNERRRKPPPSSLVTSRYDNNGRASGFVMKPASYPELTLTNALPMPRSAEPVHDNHAATFIWPASSDTASEFFLQGPGSGGGTSFLGPKHPLIESYDGVTDSNCALSLLSSQTWGSRNTAPSSVELNNRLNFNGTPMMQFAADYSQPPNATPWYLKGIDSGNRSPQVVPVLGDLGLGRISPPLHSHLHGEIDVSQQGRRHCMDLGESGESDSSHWSF